MNKVTFLSLFILIIFSAIFICLADDQILSKNAHQLLRDRLEQANTNQSIVCAVGDSITAGFDWDELLLLKYPGIIQNDMGRGGDTTLDIIGRLDMILETKAEIYLLAIGINDVRCNDKRGATNWEEFSENMTIICNNLKEDFASELIV
jgi:lysophospholipase L1-like esterase